jgi:hypothetical protein
MEVDPRKFEELRKSFEINYGLIEPYLEFKSVIFHGLKDYLNEANACILMSAPVALITLTNFILERILKTALIYNEVGFIPSSKDDYSTGDSFREADKTYSNKTLEKTVELCVDAELITEPHCKYIEERIRKQLRNGFSHASTGWILKDIPDSVPAVSGSFSCKFPVQQFDLDVKINPAMQYHITYSFAQNVALKYYDFVFKLIGHIEARLKKKHNITEW